jgi:hypothetical protein
MACLDCEGAMPSEAWSALEICHDSWDNDCDGLKDLEDTRCECGPDTPCEMQWDMDTNPGVNDGNYKLCRDVSWDQAGYAWFTEGQLVCKKSEHQCETQTCNQVTKKCSSAHGGETGTWYHGRLPGEKCGDGWDNDCHGGDETCSSGGGSCPYIYSYDGTKYTLDYEAYSFSVSSLLENTTYETLENLRPVDGKLKLKLAEELPETSYTNYLRILSVDHPAGTRVMPDQEGQMHTVRNAVPPVSCADAQGGDCLGLLSEADGDAWSDDLSEISISGLDDVHSEAVLEFPPSASADVKLVYRGKESGLITFLENELYKIAGGNNIETLIELSYYTGMGTTFDTDASMLHFSVWDGSEWVEQEAKYIGDARWSWSLAPLSVAPGEPIKVKVTRLIGAFPLDFVGIDYSADEEVALTELSPVFAQDQDGRDVLGALLSDDDEYLEQEPGDVTYMEFSSQPEGLQNTKRSYVAEAGGYYVPDLPDKPFNPLELLRVAGLADDEKALLEYLLPEYL